jgi:DNA-binding transcriptional LysR family regulator
MNIRYLATLCAVAEAGSMAAAARRLGLASPTVAEQIHALENELRATLVRRSGRKVLLSEAGEVVLSDARDILSKLDEMRQAVHVGQLRGSLRVGSITTALTSFVPGAVLRPGFETLG